MTVEDIVFNAVIRPCVSVHMISTAVFQQLCCNQLPLTLLCFLLVCAQQINVFSQNFVISFTFLYLINICVCDSNGQMCCNSQHPEIICYYIFLNEISYKIVCCWFLHYVMFTIVHPPYHMRFVLSNIQKLKKGFLD